MKTVLDGLLIALLVFMLMYLPSLMFRAWDAEAAQIEDVEYYAVDFNGQN